MSNPSVPTVACFLAAIVLMSVAGAPQTMEASGVQEPTSIVSWSPGALIFSESVRQEVQDADATRTPQSRSRVFV